MAALTPMKAIRAKCLDCSVGSYKEVSECPIPECPLYPYRFGRRPTQTINEESKRKPSTGKKEMN